MQCPPPPFHIFRVITPLSAVRVRVRVSQCTFADQLIERERCCTATPVITHSILLLPFIGTHVRASALLCDRARERRHSRLWQNEKRADSCPCQRMQKKRGIDLKPDAVLLLFFFFFFFFLLKFQGISGAYRQR